MKIVKKVMLAVAMGATALLGAEEVLVAWNNAAWVLPHWRKFTQMDEFLEISGHVRISSKRSFEVDPDAEYEISGQFRTPGSQKDLTRVEFGFIPLDEDGVEIPAYAVLNANAPLCSLAADAKAGDTVLRIKGVDKLRPGMNYLAFNAKADYSDLPNKEVFQAAKISPDGAEHKVTLKAPLKKDYASGTVIRLHCRGELWSGTSGKKAGREWTTFSGKVKGINLTGKQYNNRKWYPGTGRAKLFILIGSKQTIQFKDVTVKNLSADTEE